MQLYECEKQELIFTLYLDKNNLYSFQLGIHAHTNHCTQLYVFRFVYLIKYWAILIHSAHLWTERTAVEINKMNLKKTVDINSLDSSEFKEWIASFDVVLSDCDGL